MRSGAVRFEHRPTLGRSALLVGGALLFVAGGAWLFSTGEQPAALVGLAAIVVFGLAGVLGVVNLATGRGGVVIEDSGLTLLGVGSIGWDQVASIEIAEARGQRWLAIEPLDPGFVDGLPAVPRLMAGLNRAFGFAPLAITPVQLDVPLETLIAELDAARYAWEQRAGRS